MAVNQPSTAEREILRPLWKVHILYHASERPVVAHWMLEELREHGYQVSPGTLYPLMKRMVRHRWLDRDSSGRYRLTKAGRNVLIEVRARLRELQREVLR